MTTTYQDLLDAEIQTEIERPFKEIIEVQAVRIKELNASYDFTKAQIAELESLRTQIAEQAAQIELLREAVAEVEVEAKYFALIYDKDIEAEGFKEEGDMYGWNFHNGMRSGAVEMHLNMTKLLKALTTTPSQALADFAAKVRNEAYEKAAVFCDLQQDEPECPERASYCAEAIRNLKELP